MEYRVTAITEDGTETRLCTIIIDRLSGTKSGSLSNAQVDHDAVAAVPECDRRALLTWASMWLLDGVPLPEDKVDLRLASDFYKAFVSTYTAEVKVEPGTLQPFDPVAATTIADRMRRRGLPEA